MSLRGQTKLILWSGQCSGQIARVQSATLCTTSGPLAASCVGRVLVLAGHASSHLFTGPQLFRKHLLGSYAKGALHRVCPVVWLGLSLLHSWPECPCPGPT